MRDSFLHRQQSVQDRQQTISTEPVSGENLKKSSRSNKVAVLASPPINPRICWEAGTARARGGAADFAKI
ncbi:MAG: hypothetical protein M3N42_15755 [Cyanobacteriota bacterium]|nr:hypothetical protein [Cyanobacteriota bacterium]